MKNFRRLIAIFLLLIFYAYFVNVTNFPSKILVYEDSYLNMRLCPFLTLNGEIQASSNENSNSYELKLSLGNTVLKNIDLKLAEKIKVVPVRRFGTD